MDLVDLLLELFYRARAMKERLETFIKEHPNMNQSTREALQRVADALTSEIQEVRTLFQQGADSTEIDQALDSLAADIGKVSDAVTAAEGGGELPEGFGRVTPQG